jgi:hypothetical protein
MTRAGDSIDSTPVKTGVTAKDLYDASPRNTFRAFTSEFTFRVNSNGQTDSEKVPASEEDSKGHRDAQEGLMDQFNALELVEPQTWKRTLQIKSQKKNWTEAKSQVHSSARKSLLPHFNIQRIQKICRQNRFTRSKCNRLSEKPESWLEKLKIAWVIVR